MRLRTRSRLVMSGLVLLAAAIAAPNALAKPKQVPVQLLAINDFHGHLQPNTPGTIDSDYRGPLGVLLINLGDEPFVIGHGERIAQMIVAPVVQARFDEVRYLGDTERGAGGFGSTGRR